MSNVELVERLDKWFASKLADLPYGDPTRAYVANVLGHRRYDNDLSNHSLVLAFADARYRADFAGYQRIGDWVLWVDVFYPEFVVERDLSQSLARQSYYACHRMMRGQWPIYEELADKLPTLIHEIRSCVIDNNIVCLKNT